MVRGQKGTGRWLVVRTWVVEADTAGEARAAAASERGWPLTETVTSLATDPPAAMPVSRPGRPARSTDFCPRLITFTTEEDGQEQVAPCRSPLTVVADGAGVIESVCRAGHRYATCACQQPDCTGWKAINVGATTRGSSHDQLGRLPLVPNDVLFSPAVLGAGGGTPTPSLLFTGQQRTVHWVLLSAVLAAQVGWAVQPVHSMGPSDAVWMTSGMTWTAAFVSRQLPARTPLEVGWWPEDTWWGLVASTAEEEVGMVEVGDRVLVESEKVGAATRSGVVTDVDGSLITMRWDSGSSSTFVPSAGCLQVTGHEPQAQAANNS